MEKNIFYINKKIHTQNLISLIKDIVGSLVVIYPYVSPLSDLNILFELLLFIFSYCTVYNI